MASNEHTLDRAVRVILGLALIALAYFKLGLGAGAILGIVVAVVGVIALLTGISGFCPAYKLVGMSTCPLKKS